ncbi:MAG TPA: hypothetical protein VGN18_19440 [Jatrophihabitans sp.]|uniref:hypothetical protein n=1 Tax=Jatrophihabitans sp. TaxID=1932789 RepID=UPI002DFB6D8F|nr:hypothetical protein [Jatrophihabitans sp.]
MREPDPRVPPEVEQYLIDVHSRAGEMGGAVSGHGRAGARGGARAAGRLRTIVEDRAVPSAKTGAVAQAQLTESFPAAERLPAHADVLRLGIPVGLMGLQMVIVDITPAGAGSLLVRAFGKEGLISRKPTARTADQVAQLLAS